MYATCFQNSRCTHWHKLRIAEFKGLHSDTVNTASYSKTALEMTQIPGGSMINSYVSLEGGTPGKQKKGKM